MRGFYGNILGWIVLISFMPVSHGLAWGPQGHRIVGVIAELHLEPEIRNRILREFNIKHLSNVANWADEIKRHRKATRSFHYTNIDRSSHRYKQSRDCPRKACVTEKIKQYAMDLHPLGRSEGWADPELQQLEPGPGPGGRPHLHRDGVFLLQG